MNEDFVFEKFVFRCLNGNVEPTDLMFEIVSGIQRIVNEYEISISNSNNNIPLFMSLIHIPVGFNDFFK